MKNLFFYRVLGIVIWFALLIALINFMAKKHAAVEQFEMLQGIQTVSD